MKSRSLVCALCALASIARAQPFDLSPDSPVERVPIRAERWTFELAHADARPVRDGADACLVVGSDGVVVRFEETVRTWPREESRLAECLRDRCGAIAAIEPPLPIADRALGARCESPAEPRWVWVFEHPDGLVLIAEATSLGATAQHVRDRLASLRPQVARDEARPRYVVGPATVPLGDGGALRIRAGEVLRDEWAMESSVVSVTPLGEWGTEDREVTRSISWWGSEPHSEPGDWRECEMQIGATRWPARCHPRTSSEPAYAVALFQTGGAYVDVFVQLAEDGSASFEGLTWPTDAKVVPWPLREQDRPRRIGAIAPIAAAIAIAIGVAGWMLRRRRR